MIKGFTPRLYQETILAAAAQKNTLVVLPTGMGKTNVFLMLAAQRLKHYPRSKILLIGPTRPLIDQYYAVFRDHFEIIEEEMAIFTGHVPPKKREAMWQDARIIFSTPQGLENDIISRRIQLEDVSLLGFDEAHRAVGNYSYVFVAKQYMRLAKYPRIVAMTASPGSDMEKIQEVCKNLYVEAIEVRTDEDPDVKPYIKEIQVDWVGVQLTPPFEDVRKPLQNFLRSRADKLRGLGVLQRKSMNVINKSELLAMQAELRSKVAQGEKDYSMWTALSLLAEIMKVSHALELLETQGVVSLCNYLDKLYADSRTTKTKAIQNILQDEQFKTAYLKASEMREQKIEHPKLIELQRLTEEYFASNKDSKIIIFNQYRDNGLDIKETLNKIDAVKAEIFVGQQKKGESGLSQKQQKALLDEFREGNFNVLVATSIGEEGLDIPKVDLVVFFEPVPSVIRQVQRRGRTGRQDKGRVVVLMTKDTRDEAYRWVAHHKEKRMYRNLGLLRRKLGLELNSGQMAGRQESLSQFTARESSPQRSEGRPVKKEQELVVFADHREKGSQVIKELVDMDIVVKMESLPSADFVLSSRVGVEFKAVSDFVGSIIDGRLLQQLRELKRKFERPIVIIEGKDDIYGVRDVHPHAIQGMLATIAISFSIPIIQSRSPKETASLLRVIAKREQDAASKEFSLHTDRKPMTIKEQQEYLVSALPGVGPSLAKPLLKHFKSIKNIINASVYELQQVEGIGKVKAGDIKRLFEEEYRE